MNDCYGRTGIASGTMKRADAGSTLGGILYGSKGNPDIESAPPPPGGMVTIGIILDRSRKLAELANELANRISGPVPTKGEACGVLEDNPMSNLNSAALEIDETLFGVEATLLRALQGL